MQIDPQVDERLPYGVAFNFCMMLDYIQKFSSKENCFSSLKNELASDGFIDYSVWKSALISIFESSTNLNLSYEGANYRFSDADLILMEDHKQMIIDLVNDDINVYELCLKYANEEPLSQTLIIEYIYKSFGINVEKHLKKTFDNPTNSDYIQYLKDFKQNIKILMPVTLFVQESMSQIIKYQKETFESVCFVFETYLHKDKSELSFVQLKEFFNDCGIDMLKDKFFLKNLK